VFWSFANTWQAVFREGVCDHTIKELCRVYVSRTVKCEYCGNQRSVQASAQGLSEGKYDQLLNFETSDAYDERQKAALAYAEAITWRLDPDDAFWERLYRHFSEPELVELGYFIALTMGQQSWLRLLDIEHHEVLVGDSASMAPGFENPGCTGSQQDERRLLGQTLTGRRSAGSPRSSGRRLIRSVDHCLAAPNTYAGNLR